MSHTPGPWHVVNEDTNGVQIHAAGGAFVGYAWWWMHGENLPSPAAAKANARLIASAPEMLELLEEAIMYVEECEAFHKPECRTLSKRIRAAIAKASDVAPLTQ